MRGRSASLASACSPKVTRNKFAPAGSTCETPLMAAIWLAAGGRFNPSPEELFTEPASAPASPGLGSTNANAARTVPRSTPLWPYLVTAAILLFVLDVALRRIDFSLWWPVRKWR